MTDDRAAFIAAIQAEPDDDVPRLVFADWLEEQGDPHGEFIRVQCQLATMERNSPEWNSLREREATLLKTFDADWVQPLLTLGARGVYVRRGFVDEVRLDAALFVQHANEVLRLAPALRVLNLRKARNELDAVLLTPELERIRVLDLRMGRVGPDVKLLADSPRVANLQGLNLRANHVLTTGVVRLASSPHLCELRNLDLAGNEIGPDGVTAIVNSPYLTRLEQLRLGTNPLGGSVVDSLMKWQHLSQVRHVELDFCGVDLDDVERLVTSPQWNPTTQLVVNRSAPYVPGRDTEENQRIGAQWAASTLRLQSLGLRIHFYG